MLFTRAKRQLIIMTSIKPTDILALPSSHRGVHVFKGSLEFAASGRLERGDQETRPPDSDFEVQVARLLDKSNYEAVPKWAFRATGSTSAFAILNIPTVTSRALNATARLTTLALQ